MYIFLRLFSRYCRKSLSILAMTDEGSSSCSLGVNFFLYFRFKFLILCATANCVHRSSLWTSGILFATSFWYFLS